MKTPLPFTHAQHLPVPGFSHLRVDADGNFYRLTYDGFLIPVATNPVKTSPNKTYLKVTARTHDGSFKAVYAHRAVLLAFVGEPKEGEEACHGNDDSHDNRLINLRWASRKDNGRDKSLNGHSVVGERNWKSRTSEQVIRAVHADLVAGKTYAEILASHNVSSHIIKSVSRGTTWKHLRLPKVIRKRTRV